MRLASCLARLAVFDCTAVTLFSGNEREARWWVAEYGAMLPAVPLS